MLVMFMFVRYLWINELFCIYLCFVKKNIYKIKGMDFFFIFVKYVYVLKKRFFFSYFFLVFCLLDFIF